MFSGAESVFKNNQGEHRLAREPVEKAIPIYRKLGDSKSLARSLVVQGIASAFSGDLNVASTSIQKSVNICRQLGYKWEIAWGLSALAGLTFQTQGRAAEKEIDAYVEESLAAAQESRDPSMYVYLSELLARQAFQRGDIAEARRNNSSHQQPRTTEKHATTPPDAQIGSVRFPPSLRFPSLASGFP